MALTVRFDAKEFDATLDLAQREVKNACRRAVDQSARAARKVAVVALASDINAPKSAFASAVPTVRGTTAGSLTATWTITKKRILIAATRGVRLPTLHGGGLTASTFSTTGGGSASLHARKAFTIRVGGQTLVMIRTGKGRSAIKPIYAENPVAGMSQDDGAPRKVWTETADRELGQRLPIEIQRALNGERITPDSGSGGE